MKPALLCIDLQHLSAVRGHGIFAESNEHPFSPQEENAFFDRLDKTVLPNIEKLQAVFRDKGLEVLHIRTRSKTQNGRDRTFWQKRLGLLATPGSREADFIDAVMPRGDELIINKTGAGPFGNSNLHALLIQLDISQLYCCGVHTDQSVESTIRSAADFGYCPELIDDACAAIGNNRHEDAVERLKGQHCEVIGTDKLVEDLKQHLRSVK